jgi:hypothetical protein
VSWAFRSGKDFGAVVVCWLHLDDLHRIVGG